MSSVKRTREEEDDELERAVRQRLLDLQPILTLLPSEMVTLIVLETIHDNAVFDERNVIADMMHTNTTLRDITIGVIRSEYGKLLHALATMLGQMDWQRRNTALAVAYDSTLTSVYILNAKLGLRKRTKARLRVIGTSTLSRVEFDALVAESEATRERDAFHARVLKFAGDARDPTFAQIALALDETWPQSSRGTRTPGLLRLSRRLYDLWAAADWGKNAAFAASLSMFPDDTVYFTRYVLVQLLGVPDFTFDRTFANILMKFWFDSRDPVMRRVLQLPPEVAAVPTSLRDTLVAYDRYALEPVENGALIRPPIRGPIHHVLRYLTERL